MCLFNEQLGLQFTAAILFVIQNHAIYVSQVLLCLSYCSCLKIRAIFHNS